MGKYRGLDSEEGWIQRRLVALERAMAENAAARRLVIATDYAQVDIDGFDLGPPWTQYGITQVPIAPGFTHAIINMFASAGTTFAGTGAGNVGVQPYAGGQPGSGISTGKTGGGAISVNSTLATKIAFDPSWTYFNIWAYAYASGNPRAANTGNVHMSVSVLFVRS